MEPQKRKKSSRYPSHHQQLIKNPSENRDHLPDHQDRHLEIKVMKIEIKAMIIEVQAMIIEIEVMIVEIIEIKVMTVGIEAMIVEIETEGFTQKEKVIEKDLEVQGIVMIQIGGQIIVIVISVGKNLQHRRGRNQLNPALVLLCLGQVLILVLMIPWKYLRNLPWPAR